jgi:hypothetical protein
MGVAVAGFAAEEEAAKAGVTLGPKATSIAVNEASIFLGASDALILIDIGSSVLQPRSDGVAYRREAVG